MSEQTQTATEAGITATNGDDADWKAAVALVDRDKSQDNEENTDAGGADSGDEEKNAGQAANDVIPSDASGQTDAAPRADDLVAQLEQRLQRAEHDRRSMAGRVGALTRRNAELAALAKAAQANGAAPRSGGSQGDSEKISGLEALAREYPELAGPIAEQIRNLQSQVHELSQFRDNMSAAQKEMQELEQLRPLAERYPDILSLTRGKDDILADEVKPKFLEWLGGQPAFVQNAVSRNSSNIVDYQEVADVLEAFARSQTGTAASPTAKQAELTPATPTSSQDKRRRQLQDASAPTSNAGVRPTAGMPADEDAAWRYSVNLLENKRVAGRNR
jgi:hypothetical protein